MQIVRKDFENGKKIKIMYMYTLHDRFPDFDFGEDAQEDHTQFISIKPLNFSGYNFKFV